MRSIPIKIIAISTEVANTVRRTGKAPGYGHPSHTEVASGYGPCRHCLRAFVEGAEERVLFTYNPFLGAEEVPLPGPIFIHAGECKRYRENAAYPEGLRQFSSVISAYGSGQRLVTQIPVENGQQPAIIERLLALQEVRYIHVRDKNAGCYDFRVERASGSSTT